MDMSEIIQGIIAILERAKRDPDGPTCFYPDCNSRKLTRMCTCGDHSYGPDYRRSGKSMCRLHSMDHGGCAGYGNW